MAFELEVELDSSPMSDAPENPKVSRRLAAILAADIAGYSALMGADEETTVRDLKAHQTVVLPMIREHGGRVIDTAGDGILAEFASVLGAVKSALAIQKTMAERNETVGPAKRMQFRIGINQGDLVVDDARVYGDGVNIAARLESIADPGGICISGKVHDEIAGKIDAQWEDLGQQSLKNIAQPIRVYRCNSVELKTPALATKPPLALPDKPSIAVLPFTNFSGDKEQEYFSDGITEDIITELSRFSDLFVIARNSSFTYKGKTVDVRQVSRELGVRYVLEGSVRRAGDQVRVTAQLIDALTGAHRWAERYDRKLEDVFAVQDEVARNSVTVIAAHVNNAEVERTLLKPPSTWLAYDYYMRAAGLVAQLGSSLSVEHLSETRRLLQQALSIDPNYARAYTLLSVADFISWVNLLETYQLDPTILDQAYQWASKAVQLDANLPAAHAQLGWVLCRRGEHDRGIAEFQRAASLNPNFIDWRYGSILLYAGEPTRAIEVLERHMRADPFYPPLVPSWLGLALYMLERYSEALVPLRECASRAPNFRAVHMFLAATYAQLGQMEEAQAEAAEVLRIHSQWTINDFGKPANRFRRAKDAEHFFNGLRKAGLPE